MHEVTVYGEIVLVVAGTLYLALLASKTTQRFPIPGPALFLLGAAVASELFPRLRTALPILTVERLGVVALIVILFDGGMHVGWRRLRGSFWPIASLGVLGTFATAGLVALFGHWALGFSWTTAGLIGAAIAPTDPAVMFSVLGNRQVGGRTGTILEGESGANDPVGIALMLGLIALATTDSATGWTVAGDFVVEMAVGLAVGVAGGLALAAVMRRVSLPNDALYPLQTLASAGIVYGAASVAHGSGFLAVFVAGLVVGDVRAPYKAEIRRFHGSLASIGEIGVFVALGLTVSLHQVFSDNRWLEGIALALVVSFVARPLVAGLLLAPTRLRRGEKLFVIWSGLKGAVPILLAAFALLEHVTDATRIYDIVFVVVLLSVLVQGTGLPLVAARLGVPMRLVEPEPWSVSIRLRREPHDLRRFVVGAGSRAAGLALRDVPLSDHGWVSLIVRDGEPVPARGSTVLEPGDEVLVVADAPDQEALRRLLEG
jgi:cell volume regulation protein A